MLSRRVQRFPASPEPGGLCPHADPGLWFLKAGEGTNETGFREDSK